MRVRWTTLAATDLYRIAQNIQQHNPSAAARVANVLYNGASTLAKFPESGRIGRIEGTREVVFAGLPYILVYRLKKEDVEILRIYHAAQDWP